MAFATARSKHTLQMRLLQLQRYWLCPGMSIWRPYSTWGSCEGECFCRCFAYLQLYL